MRVVGVCVGPGCNCDGEFMNDILPILYGFGDLAVIIVLLSVLRSTTKPRPQPQDEWGSHDEPFEDPYDTNFDDDETRPSIWNKQVH